jgi:adenine-specific DNA glycosylase
MSREKQIEEMAETICRRELDPNCSTCYFNKDCRDYLVAKKLYNAGYRKQTEVAREIFAEIERILLLNKVCFDSGIYYEQDVEWDIAELKMKYTEDKT